MSTALTGAGRDRRTRMSSLGPARDRHLGWAALAVTLMIGIGALGGYLSLRAGSKTPVVVLTRTVPAGHVITRADVSTVTVAGALKTVAAADLDAVVGRRVVVTVLAGALLQRSMLGAGGALEPGQAQVGLAVTSGQAPADGVQAGETVEVLQIPGSGTGTGPADPAHVLVPAAPVWSVRTDPARSGGILLTVTVPADLVGQIVAASGAGQVAVARVVTGS